MNQNVRIIKSDDTCTSQTLVEYEGFFFSGGEPHIKIPNPEELEGANLVIDARVGTMNDLGMLLAVTNTVRQYQPKRVKALIPYFPGARADWQEPGCPLTVQVYAEIINLQDYDQVYMLDPHSPVTPALVEKTTILNQVPLIEKFLPKDLAGLICPDAGAEKRTMKLAKAIGCGTVVFAHKHRDTRTGALSGFSMNRLDKEGPYVVVDDICDGGGTFLGLAEEYEKDPKGTGPLHLWVTHGIFSKGLSSLARRFEKIGCTDSFPTDFDKFKPEDRWHWQPLQVVPILDENLNLTGAQS